MNAPNNAKKNVHEIITVEIHNRDIVTPINIKRVALTVVMFV
jgi:hypothetical protein